MSNNESTQGRNQNWGETFVRTNFHEKTNLVLFFLMYYFHPFLLILFPVFWQNCGPVPTVWVILQKNPLQSKFFKTCKNQIIIFYNHLFFHGNPALVHWGFKITRTTTILSFKLFVQKHKTSNYLILKYFKNPKPNGY
jgi:hypothetical protein